MKGFQESAGGVAGKALDMIQVTRMDGTKIFVNVEMIQSIQGAPDTVITFMNHVSLMVKDPVEDLARRIIAYQKSLYRYALSGIETDMDDGERDMSTY